jgi:hypothetical protein
MVLMMARIGRGVWWCRWTLQPLVSSTGTIATRISIANQPVLSALVSSRLPGISANNAAVASQSGVRRLLYTHKALC